ncbi:MAG: hypothetical protein U5L98_12855 [Halomonas sp.]|uniref:hypothetical protein n=1 Tax=Halomonas sp. TaxID=1486246 RepID=UPI002ACF03F5|nr:hypothetical protein [Halomonas sp.]MDZ7853496.1 hypothetical protein [Halomonas sp.]
MSNKLNRTGRSIPTDINHLPKCILTSSLGFTDEQTRRMMKTRRVLPIVEDRQKPCIDARKLWDKIGNPHGRFRNFAEDYIKPMMGQVKGAGKSATFEVEIETFYEVAGKTRQTRKGYLLSRDVAAHLAMQARTSEGHGIRQYFLDMEECVLRMERYGPIRTDHLTGIDNSVYHSAISETGSKVYAQDTERFLKGMVAEVISGFSASEWWEELSEISGAKGKGIRDVLDQGDLKLYRDVLQFASQLFESGMADRDQIESMVRNVYADKIDPEKYLNGVLKEAA